ncbi:hypothetical protein P3G55_23685, partial [Leptospira sp. 96542]|nr:hypothetical protein [Leptospira sp. 96542]
IANAGHHPMIFLDKLGNLQTISSYGRAINEYIPSEIIEREIPHQHLVPLCRHHDQVKRPGGVLPTQTTRAFGGALGAGTGLGCGFGWAGWGAGFVCAACQQREDYAQAGRTQADVPGRHGSLLGTG